MINNKSCSIQQINNYSVNSLNERIGLYENDQQDIIYRDSPDGEICRIIYSNGKTVIRTRKDLQLKIKKYISSLNISVDIRKANLYKDLLDLFGLDYVDFELEPADEFIEDKKYNCRHTLEFVCNTDSFIPFESALPVTKIFRGENAFKLDENFDDIMYCICSDENIHSSCYYRLNHGVFENTFAMQVFTKKDYRNMNYGKVTASAATKSICEKHGLALWVCQVENFSSIHIAEKLGYVFLGGEIKITE